MELSRHLDEKGLGRVLGGLAVILFLFAKGLDLDQTNMPCLHSFVTVYTMFCLCLQTNGGIAWDNPTVGKKAEHIPNLANYCHT